MTSSAGKPREYEARSSDDDESDDEFKETEQYHEIPSITPTVAIRATSSAAPSIIPTPTEVHPLASSSFSSKQERQPQASPTTISPSPSQTSTSNVKTYKAIVDDLLDEIRRKKQESAAQQAEISKMRERNQSLRAQFNSEHTLAEQLANTMQILRSQSKDENGRHQLSAAHKLTIAKEAARHHTAQLSHSAKQSAKAARQHLERAKAEVAVRTRSAKQQIEQFGSHAKNAAGKAKEKTAEAAKFALSEFVSKDYVRPWWQDANFAVALTLLVTALFATLSGVLGIIITSNRINNTKVDSNKTEDEIIRARQLRWVLAFTMIAGIVGIIATTGVYINYRNKQKLRN